MAYNPTGTLTTRHGIDSQNVVNGFAATQTVHLDTESVAAQQAFMLIDISDTTKWPHTNTDHVIIRHLLIEADPDTAYLGEIKIGFLSNVGATTGDFNQIIDLDIRKKSDLVIEDKRFTGGFHCQTTTHIGPQLIASTIFQTDVNLQGPSGAGLAHPSGNGDLVMLVEVAAGTVDISTTTIYETVGA